MNPLLFLNKGFYLPEGIEVNGNFTSEKEVSISGTVNGQVTVNSRIVIEKKGIINGDLRGKNIVVKGRVNGNIYCQGKISTIKEAVVTGNIYAAEARIDKLSIIKGVISHINQSKESDIATKPESEVTPKKGDEKKPFVYEMPQEKSPETEDMSLPDEPPQNWF